MGHSTECPNACVRECMHASTHACTGEIKHLKPLSMMLGPTEKIHLGACSCVLSMSGPQFLVIKYPPRGQSIKLLGLAGAGVTWSQIISWSMCH